MSETLKFLGELFDSFERVERIEEVISLGANGGIRRCALDQEIAYGGDK